MKEISRKKIIKQLKPFWKMAIKAEDTYLRKLYKIEKKATYFTGIKTVELFRMDGELVGIGNYERTMKLIRGEELCN